MTTAPAATDDLLLQADAVSVVGDADRTAVDRL